LTLSFIQEVDLVSENLQFCNLSTLFPLINLTISDVFGSDYLLSLPYFQSDYLFSNVSNIPTFIISTPEEDPTGFALNIIHQRCRIENLDSLSLNFDPENLKTHRKVISSAMSKGTWVILFYTPNPFAAGLLWDVFSQMTTTSISPSFRLIIFCSSVQYLSPLILMRTKKVYINEFFPIRNSLLQIFSHHSSAIVFNSQTKPIKRLVYYASLLVAFDNYKSHFFTTQSVVSEKVFHEIIKFIQYIVESNPFEIAFDNIHHFIAQDGFPNVMNIEDYCYVWKFFLAYSLLIVLMILFLYPPMKFGIFLVIFLFLLTFRSFLIFQCFQI
jgi:hypothetical protein